jgi:pilus assembly protein CpaF
MSFAVIISEKGGQERREVFDKNEISIGRVQGNDLLLPKGNVSKRHARIVYRDGRFIVTDLKSTNGSYVNGHRIAQATIVREGDKIYIGDFILKVEATAAPSIGPNSPREDRRTGDSEVPAVLQGDGSGATPAPRVPSGEGSAVSHIPLEHDPDDLSATGMPAIAANRTVMGESRPPRPVAMASASGIARAPAAPPVPVVTRPAASPPVPQTNMAIPSLAGVPAAARATRANAHAKESTPARGIPGSALASLLSRLGEVVDLDEGEFAPPNDSKRASIERVLREQARALQQEGEISAGSADDLVREATREVLGAGPLEALLDDDDVVEIQVARFDQIVSVREGGAAAPVEPGFTSEASLRRAVGRLAFASGHRLRDGDGTLDVRLSNGAHLTAIFPPVAAGGTVLVIRKRRRADLGLDDLVRAGTLSRAMATFLQQCLVAKSNILIAGPLGAGTTTLIGALAAATPVEDRTIAIQELDELVLPHPYGASLMVPDTAAGGARIVRVAASLRPDRLLVGVMAGEIVGQVLEAIGSGCDGVVAAVRGPSLRQALSRLVPALVASRPGLDPSSARAWIASSFDVAIEVVRPRTGRHRVLRIAEITSEGGELQTRDVYEYVAEANGEGAFQASGVVPAVVQELRAQGHRIDDSLFRRGAR